MLSWIPFSVDKKDLRSLCPTIYLKWSTFSGHNHSPDLCNPICWSGIRSVGSTVPSGRCFQTLPRVICRTEALSRTHQTDQELASSICSIFPRQRTFFSCITCGKWNQFKQGLLPWWLEVVKITPDWWFCFFSPFPSHASCVPLLQVRLRETDEKTARNLQSSL